MIWCWCVCKQQRGRQRDGALAAGSDTSSHLISNQRLAHNCADGCAWIMCADYVFVLLTVFFFLSNTAVVVFFISMCTNRKSRVTGYSWATFGDPEHERYKGALKAVSPVLFPVYDLWQPKPAVELFHLNVKLLILLDVHCDGLFVHLIFLLLLHSTFPKLDLNIQIWEWMLQLWICYLIKWNRVELGLIQGAVHPHKSWLFVLRWLWVAKW